MKLSRINKALLSLGSLGVAATIAGAGTFATFTDTETGTQSVAAGTVNISLDGKGQGVVHAEDAIADIAPGDAVSRYIDVTNPGSLALADIALGVTGTGPLVGGLHPLQLKVDNCTVAWTAAGACDGGIATTVAAAGPAVRSAGTLGTGSALAATSGRMYLKFTLSLPSGADNSYQGASAALTYTFVATQRAGTSS